MGLPGAPELNPILSDPAAPEADVRRLDGPVTHRERKRRARRVIRDCRRTETAIEAIDGFDAETSIYGFTKGAFSLIDLLEAAIRVTGPVSLSISTWTAAGQDVSRVLEFIESGRIRSSRWLVDLTFCRRTPKLANQIRQAFGPDAIRVAKNHAKFSLLENERWNVVIETSMNLNHNPRFENFRIEHDPALAGFLRGVLDSVWTRQKRELSDWRPYEIQKHFQSEL